MEILSKIDGSAIGIADYKILNDEREHLDEWLSGGNEATLAYMREHRREDPRIILENCQSLIVVLFSPQKWTYHSPIRKRLKRLLKLLQELDPEIEGRGVVDTAPLLERAWGVEANLGWVGRNSMLINPRLGSNFNIGVLLVNRSKEELISLTGGGLLEGSDEEKIEDGCLSCSGLCREVCPDGAIRDNRTIDCRVCKSYLSQVNRIEGAQLGCTICQNICPYNS